MGGITLETLKGADRVVYEAASKDFQIELLPVVWHKGYPGDDYGIWSVKLIIHKEVFSFTFDDLQYLNGIGPKPPTRKLLVPFVFLSRVGQVIKGHEPEFFEYTGNESQPGQVEKLYFQAAPILTRINQKQPQGSSDTIRNSSDDIW